MIAPLPRKNGRKTSTTRPPVSGLPVRSAELIVPGDRPRRIRKVAGEAPKGNGVFPQFRLHQDRLVCVDGAGNAVGALALRDSEMPGALIGLPNGNRALFSTNRAVYALDAKTGAVKQQRDLRFEWSPKAMHADGDMAVLCDDKQLQWLDADLKVMHTVELSCPVKKFVPLAGGMLALEHYSRPGLTTILSPDRQIRMQLRDVSAPVVDAKGRLYCIEGELEPREHPRRVVCYDPHEDRVTRTLTSTHARGVAPREDGSFLVLHDDMARQSLLLHRPDASTPRKFDFGTAGYMRELLLDRNDASAYVMFDRYKNGNRLGQTVFHIDLDAKPTLAQRIGLTSPVKKIYHVQAQQESRKLAAATRDGQLLLVSDSGATLVDPARGEEQRLGAHRGVVDGVLRERGVTSRPVSVGQGGVLGSDLAEMLDEAKSTRRDGCLDLEASGPLPSAGAPLPVPANVEFWPHKILMRDNGRTSNVFLPPTGTKFTATTAVHTTDRRFLIAAATTNGQVQCYDPSLGIGGRPVARFDVGAPVKSLMTDEKGRIVAEAENGALLFVDP